MKSYADEELKFCFLLPIEDSDEEEVKGKLVKCENCQMMLKDCEMKIHLNTHNLLKPFHCDVKGCFKKFNTEENLGLHKQYFHNNSKEESNINLSLNIRKINALKNKMKDIPIINDEIVIDNKKVDKKYKIGKYIYEDNKGNIVDEKIFLSVEKGNNESNENDNNINAEDKNKDKVILGYISNGLP